MVGVPEDGRGRKLKHPYNRVRRGKPLPITISNDDGKAEEEYKRVRIQASRYGVRHGKYLVTRLKERLPDGTVKLEVHYKGRRPETEAA